MRIRQVVLLFVACLLVTSLATAQSPNGTISGSVVDPSGAVIVGAEVVIENDATGVQYPTKTNGEGIYVVPNLPPGTYRLQVSKVGFKTLIKPHITLNVQGALAINFTLPIGAASEIVTVRGGAPLLDTQSGSVSTVIDRHFVENLPLNGRSFNTLLQLTPGVVIAPTANFGAAPGQFSIAGQRTDANNFTVDGVSANFGVSGSSNLVGQSGTGTQQAFSALGGTSSLVSVEALQEFRVETSSFAPEFGRTPGGQVILTTRSGTNDFHGGIYEYFRNDVMDANDWFANQAGSPTAPERHNDFGGYLGGPIFKDKTFFFFSYEGARLRLPQSISIQVPASSIRSSAPAAIAPFLNAYPAPNGPVSPSGDTAQFTGSFSNSATLNATSFRLDHTFNSKINLFARFSYAPSQLVSRLASLSTIQTTPVNTQMLTVGVNMLLSSRLTNSLRGNYSKQNANAVNSLDSFGGAVPLSPSLLFDSLNNGQNFGEFFPLNSSAVQTGPQVRNKSSQLNFIDDLSITSGTHQVKVGGDYRAIFLNSAPETIVAYITPSVQAFVSSGTALLSTFSKAKAELLAQSFSLYAQDTWKITSRLTMVYGLRWELSPPPSPRGATTLAAWENVSNPAGIILAPQGTPLWGTTYGNVAPRVGIAYSLTRRGDLVLRAGGGIFYDLGLGSSADLTALFPNSAGAFNPGVSIPVANLAPFLPIFSLQPPYPTASGFSPNLKLPRSYQWNVALEKSFGEKQVVSVTYVGQAGRDLLREEAFFQPNPRFRSVFNLTENGARSNYNALQIQYRRPLSARLQGLLNYTWSHSLDNASDDVVAGLSNTVISAANDYASSDFDVRHSFSGAITYDVPGAPKSGPLSHLTNGWSLDTVIVARTGFPFNGLISAPSLLGVSHTRPDIVPGQPFWISDPNAPGGQTLNPNAFSIPSTARQGTEGRNDIPGFGLTQIDLSDWPKVSDY